MPVGVAKVLAALVGLAATAAAAIPTCSPAGAGAGAGAAATSAATSAAACKPLALSTHMIKSVISRKQGVVSSAAASATLEAGFLALSIQAWLRVHPDDGHAAAFASYVDDVVASISPAFTSPAAAALLPLDRLTVAQAILAIADQHEHAAHDAAATTSPDTLTAPQRVALDTLNSSLALQRRNRDGGFWYYVYPDWSFLDGAVSFLPFMAAESLSSLSRPRPRPQPSSSPLHAPPVAADMLLQITLLYDRCFQPSTGLLAHGYDASRSAVWANNATGASPYAWGRSLGWYLAGLVNTWEQLQPQSSSNSSNGRSDDSDSDSDSDSADAAKLRRAVRVQASALLRALPRHADPATGAWFQLPAQGARAGNFLESSSTALFVFALLKALRLGLLLPPPPPTTTTTTTTTNTSSSSSSLSLFLHDNDNDNDSDNNSNADPAPTSDEESAVLRAVALRAYRYTAAHFVVRDDSAASASPEAAATTLGWNGTVAVCSLNSSASYEYYTGRPLVYNSALGEGAFVLASLEVERLGL